MNTKVAAIVAAPNSFPDMRLVPLASREYKFILTISHEAIAIPQLFASAVLRPRVSDLRFSIGYRNMIAREWSHVLWATWQFLPSRHAMASQCQQMASIISDSDVF
jgi:hypothetical protein